jgi:hypothetical protein
MNEWQWQAQAHITMVQKTEMQKRQNAHILLFCYFGLLTIWTNQLTARARICGSLPIPISISILIKDRLAWEEEKRRRGGAWDGIWEEGRKREGDAGLGLGEA